MDRSYCFDLRQTYLAVKLKFLKCRGYDTYNSREVKKEHKEETNEDEEREEEQEAPVPLVTHVNNILHSILSNVELYTKNQQLYNSNRLYAHKSYISNSFKRSIFEYKGALHCDVYDYEELSDEILKSHLSQTFFSMKMLSRSDDLLLYGQLVVDFFTTSLPKCCIQS